MLLHPTNSKFYSMLSHGPKERAQTRLDARKGNALLLAVGQRPLSAHRRSALRLYRVITRSPPKATPTSLVGAQHCCARSRQEVRDLLGPGWLAPGWIRPGLLSTSPADR